MPTEVMENLGGLMMPLFLILMIVVFYFVLIRPQQKKDKAVKKMLSELKVGDRITTIGGIFGRIKTVKEDVLTIEVGADKTEMVVARWAVRSVEESSAENDLI
ncbi:MAG: preprotein translocase subunit YajC [Christensenellales bacterium]|jgi:preprotein translocase subunit YajC